MEKWPLDKSCFVTSVTLAALKAFGLESLEWEPEILRDAFQDRFELPKMPQKLFDKLNCGYTLVGTDAFEGSIEGFLSSTAIMNNMSFDEDEIPYCTLEQCAWSVWEYINLTGDIENGRPSVKFSPDICLYLQEAGKANGVTKFPTWLDFATPENGALPDLTGDADLFSMYNARQESYISDMNAFVTQKQAVLAAELNKLKNAGIIAKNG